MSVIISFYFLFAVIRRIKLHICYKQKCKVVSLNLAHPVYTSTGVDICAAFAMRHSYQPVRGSTTKQRLKIPRCALTQFQKSFAARTTISLLSRTHYHTPLPRSLASVSSFRSHLSDSAT